MSRIYKYELALESVQELSLPMRAQIIRVDEQHGKVQLWAIVDPHNKSVERIIHIIGTGGIVAQHEKVKYINTFMMQSGAFVWHAFEVQP